MCLLFKAYPGAQRPPCEQIQRIHCNAQSLPHLTVQNLTHTPMWPVELLTFKTATSGRL